MSNSRDHLPSRSKKFFSYYQPYWGLLVVDLVCAVIVSATALVLPLCARYITQNILQNNAPDALNQIILMGLVMVGLILIQIVCNTFVDYQGHMMGTHMESDMRRDLFDHYQKLSFSFYDEQRTGHLLSRITNDLFAISELAHHGPEESLIALLKLLGAFTILLSINIPLTMAIFLLMPFMAFYALHYNRRLNSALTESRTRIGDINAQVEDMLTGIKVVQSFTNETVEKQKFAYENARFVTTRRDIYRSEAFFYEGMMAFTQVLTMGVIIFGGIAILHASLDLTDLVTYLLFIAILIDPISKFANLARLYQEGVTGFNRFMEIMEIEPEIQDSPDAIELKQAQGHVEFRNVSFKYREHLDYVVKNISLEIRMGEYVALVGVSGIGKTTLLSLLPRFYEVTEGDILIDGHNICDISLRSLRRNIGIVHQDTYLFSGTVYENINYGKPSANQAEIIDSAVKANAHGFIMALPNGYNTDIGQRGVKLSGGQKQRLSIARLFLKDPPIIIFDEATSSLDNESERAVQLAMEQLADNRTTLVIAHRLSTVQNADRILMLSEDGISEQGTHKELLARDGMYARLYSGQLRL